MILDSISNGQQYTTLHPDFAKALKFVSDNAETIPAGKYMLDGDNLFVMIVETELKDAAKAKLEAHRKYIDVQVVLEGTESYAWASLDDCKTPQGAFDTDSDIIFFNDQPTSLVTAKKGQFAIFFPADGHAPLIGEGKIRKAIVKVKCK